MRKREKCKAGKLDDRPSKFALLAAGYMKSKRRCLSDLIQSHRSHLFSAVLEHMYSYISAVSDRQHPVLELQSSTSLVVPGFSVLLPCEMPSAEASNSFTLRLLFENSILHSNSVIELGQVSSDFRLRAAMAGSRTAIPAAVPLQHQLWLHETLSYAYWCHYIRHHYQPDRFWLAYIYNS